MNSTGEGFPAVVSPVLLRAATPQASRFFAILLRSPQRGWNRVHFNSAPRARGFADITLSPMIDTATISETIVRVGFPRGDWKIVVRLGFGSVFFLSFCPPREILLVEKKIPSPPPPLQTSTNTQYYALARLDCREGRRRREFNGCVLRIIK